MVVSTKTECPECLKAGKHLILQVDLGSNPKRIYCENGHSVTDAKQVNGQQPLPTPAPEPDRALAPSPTALAGIPSEAPKVPEPAKLEAPPDPSPAPAVVPLILPMVNHAPRAVSPLERLARLGYVELPGGDVMMQIRIPEAYVGSLKEAASRYFPPTAEKTDTFQEHMQSVMDTAIRLGWAN